MMVAIRSSRKIEICGEWNASSRKVTTSRTSRNGRSTSPTTVTFYALIDPCISAWKQNLPFRFHIIPYGYF
uniref:Uncharacterized protein n=1 Tax=Panagrellus redivivus TaxID=6233 RepID=A0A7E4WD68_PANRE